MAVTLDDGVVPYLDATKGQHNGHGARDFVRLLKQLDMPQDGFVRVTKKAMAEHFGVHRHTMQDWIDRYNSGHAPDTSGPSV